MGSSSLGAVSARRAAHSHSRITQSEELDAVRELCKKNPVIPCHSCRGMMRIFTRRIFYRGSPREYLTYRCSKKQCQTSRALRSLYQLLILSYRNDPKLNPLLASHQLQAALRDESVFSEVPETEAESRRLVIRRRIAGLLEKAVASFAAQASSENLTEPDTSVLTTLVSSDAVGSGDRGDRFFTNRSLVSSNASMSCFPTSSSDGAEASSIFHFDGIVKTEPFSDVDLSGNDGNIFSVLEDSKTGIPLISAAGRDSAAEEVVLSVFEDKSKFVFPSLLPKKEQ